MPTVTVVHLNFYINICTYILLDKNKNLRKVQVILVIVICYFWEYYVICKFIQNRHFFLQNICIDD